jgi:predicted secreted hydrolase
VSNRLRRCVAVLAILLLGAGNERFAIATAPYTYHFPRDHFSHDAYHTEWWYFTGHLRDASGRRFGFELTFFRIGLEPHASRWRTGESRWRSAQLYPAHFAITDERAGTFVYSQTLARDALAQGFASQHELNVRANRWFLTGTAGERPRMRLHADDGTDAIDLEVQSAKPPAVHGRGGISLKGSCASCASHYYSFTRLQTGGTLTRDGVRYTVNGISWMDHEYGSGELQPDQVGWDWFSMQLNDGREVMLYRLRERDGSTTPQSSGSLIGVDGGVRYLPLRAFAIQATSSWRSPHTHARYPSGWHIHVDGIAPDLVLTPVLADQELVDATGTTYWEGAVDIRDANSGRALGVGYVELTGYAASLRL